MVPTQPCAPASLMTLDVDCRGLHRDAEVGDLKSWLRRRLAL